jgi:DNA invertase Pin-like site-specific DNA recombinase
MADLENTLQSERIRAGIEARRKQGLQIGRKSSRTEGMTEAIKIMIEKGVGVREIMGKLQTGTKYYYEVAKRMNNESVIH